MRLALSSAAAPDASLDDLLEACARRGLSGVELEAGHAHGLTGTDPETARRARERMSEGGVDVVGFRMPLSGSPGVRTLAAVGRALEAPLVLAPDGPGADLALETLEHAGALASAGARALVSLEGVSAETWCVTDLLGPLATAPADVGVAWEVDPERLDDPSRASWVAHELVERLGRTLRLIRLRGGGPEAARQEGHGVGALMGTLALAGYDGALVLAPTSPRYRVAWSAWLGRRGGWGCGSRTADPELVQLVTAPASGEGDR